jgi:dihydroflavonol-4-reductase
MNIAVTGASGHVGRNLCQMLVERGHQVKAFLHKDFNVPQKMQLDYVEGDVTNEKDLERLCHGCEVVYNLAARISIRKYDRICRKVNIESCTNMIRAARKTGVRKIIHFSSIHAFRQEPLSEELNETRDLSIDSNFSYDRSKAVGQKLMMDASTGSCEVVVLNPTAIIGPNDIKPSLMGNALIRFYKGLNPVLIPGGYNWVDVRDVCISALNAIEYATAGCYLLSGSWQSLGTVADEIEKLGGHKAPRLEIPVWMARMAAPVFNIHSLLNNKPPLYTNVSLQSLTKSHRNISSDKARTMVGHLSRPFTETLSDTITWFKENNYI